MGFVQFFSTAFLGFFAFQLASAQTADEVITKHIDAIGGANAWKKVNTLRIEGTMNVQGMDVLIKSTIVNNKAFREDIAVSAMGWDGYYILLPIKDGNLHPGADKPLLNH
jgi:hypothetical protein